VIVGFDGDEAQRVYCIRGSDHDIPVWSGKCGDEVEKVFGVRVSLLP